MEGCVRCGYHDEENDLKIQREINRKMAKNNAKRDAKVQRERDRKHMAKEEIKELIKAAVAHGLECSRRRMERNGTRACKKRKNTLAPVAGEA
jgi:Zn ribbon nucleic-acid-binding protein